MLPGKNGFDICKELRQQGVDTAILMLTAKTRVVDRVVGLKLGADDYLAKPFDPDELLARVEALLRRVSRENLTPVVSFSFGGMEIDFQRGHATRNGQPVPFAAKEIQLLKFLVDHRGAVVSRDELLQHVWEYQPDVNSRTVDVHVAWLRQKIEENPQNPRHLLTVRGVGYRFVP
jgi:two-component system, OmpR family, alkaline phosphatase synthesis response regulator PhoP